MSTWADIINGAFEDLATIQVGETLTTSLQTDAFTRLKQRISSINTEEATVFGQVRQAFSLSAGVSAYTLGSSGTFATTGGLRAQKVLTWRAYYSTLLSSGGPIIPLDQFGAAAQQLNGELASIPKIVGADTSYPLVNVRVFPPPSSLPGTLELGYTVGVTAPVLVGDTISLPDGWELMLRTDLALDMFPIYARPGVSLEVIAGAANRAKQALVSQNARGSAPQQQG